MKKFVICFLALLLFIQSSAYSTDVSNIDDAINVSSEYLKSEVLSSPGSSYSDWSAIALSVSGKSFDKDTYLKKLSEYVTEKYSEENLLSANKSTEWHRIALAVMASGADARSFNGTDLISDGVFNRENLGRQGINAYIWALITIEAGRFEDTETAINTVDSIIAAILSNQNDDGGFSLSGRISDPDITAMALYALAPYRSRGEVSNSVNRAVEALSSMQNDDGGFSSAGAPNAESAAQVIIALSALGIDLGSDTRFIKNGKNAADALLEYRTDTGFSHLLGNDTDTMATYQSLIALCAYKKRSAVYNFYTVPKETKAASAEIKEAEAETVKTEIIEEEPESAFPAEIETETFTETETLIYPSEASSEPFEDSERSQKLYVVLFLSAAVIIIAAVCVIIARRIRYEK